MTDAIAWTIQQMARTDLPGAAKLSTAIRPGTRAAAIHRLLDRTWRTRQEISRAVGCDIKTASRVLGDLWVQGTAEMLPASGSRPAQYRSAA